MPKRSKTSVESVDSAEKGQTTIQPSDPEEIKQYVLLILSIDEHESDVYAIPSTEKELSRKLRHFHNQQIDFFDKEQYNEEERKTIRILGGRNPDSDSEQDEPIGHVGFLEQYKLKTPLSQPITITQIVNISMPMA